VSHGWHSAKKSLPSASCGTLGEDFFKTLNTFFTESLAVDTRQRCLCRVSDPGHSTKCIFKLKKSLPSARDLAHGKEGKYYNQTTFLSHSISLTSLHSTAAAALHLPAPPPPRPASPRPPPTPHPPPVPRHQ
jgi:hypothetical protein